MELQEIDPADLAALEMLVRNGLADVMPQRPRSAVRRGLAVYRRAQPLARGAMAWSRRSAIEALAETLAPGDTLGGGKREIHRPGVLVSRPDRVPPRLCQRFLGPTRRV
jgi:hypothetical protein